MKKVKNKIIIGIICIGVLLVAGCTLSMAGSDNMSRAKTKDGIFNALAQQKLNVKQSQEISVAAANASPVVGEAVELEADSKTSVKYTALTPKLATVTEDGSVNCKAMGMAKFRVDAEESSVYSGETIVVGMKIEGKAQTIKGIDSKYTLERNETMKLTPGAKTKIFVTNRTPDIIKIKPDCTVVAIEPGIGEISVVASSDGEYEEVKQLVQVEVIKSVEERQTEAREAAVAWAVDIADDNSFHYGKPSWAHHFGCYFCGTNQKSGSIKRKKGASIAACEKTWCCNPFVTAAYKHGAGAPEVDCVDPKRRINLANDNNPALNNKEAFKRIGKPASITSLEVGDVLLTPTHAMMYAGDGKVVEAAHHDDGIKNAKWDDSIRCAPIKARQWKRVSKIYRYIGVGKF